MSLFTCIQAGYLLICSLSAFFKVLANRINNTNVTNLYPPTKGYFRKRMYITKHKSQLSKLIITVCQVCLVRCLMKKYAYIYTISITDLQTQPQRSRVCVNSKCYLACRSTSLPVSLISNMTTFRKKKTTRSFDPTQGVEGMCYGSILAFVVL